MRLIALLLACFTLFVAGGALAQTKISKEMGNNYYNNCMTKSDPRLTPQSQKELCACTVVKMMEAMTVEELMVMSQESQDGRLMLNKMLTQVYAPCMEYPVYDLVEDNCIKDPKIAAVGNTTLSKKKLCGCVARKTGKWFADEGRGLMTALLEQDPNITDPISPVMESKPFNDAAFNNLRLCLQGK